MPVVVRGETLSRSNASNEREGKDDASADDRKARKAAPRQRRDADGQATIEVTIVEP